MELFELQKKYFAIIGIDSCQAIQKNPFNKKNSATLLILISAFISTNAFIWFEATTFQEYTESFYVAATSIIATAGPVIYLTKMSQLFEFIKNMEHLIKTSKWKFFIQKYI